MSIREAAMIDKSRGRVRKSAYAIMSVRGAL
jgi:hypothetical protein